MLHEVYTRMRGGLDVCSLHAHRRPQVVIAHCSAFSDIAHAEFEPRLRLWSLQRKILLQR